jgi:hypothetical protein
MTNTDNSKRPTHAVFQVIGDGETARWVRIGSAWVNRDNKGFNLALDAYPAMNPRLGFAGVA